jgi:phospholipase/lecithinase/hemolysin
MIKRRTTMGLAAVAFAALAAGCGGGGPVIDGFAATGAAMDGATVTAKCVDGPDLSATTDAAGLFRLKLPTSGVLPCMVKAVGADGTTLHSYAAQSGRMNVTPLTELTVSRALGAPAASEFAGFNAAKAQQIDAQMSPAKADIKAQVEALTGQVIIGDLFTSTFKVGDSDDKVLDAFKEKLEGLGRPLSEVVAMAAGNKPLTSASARVKVFGDSLSDSGTFGVKFTVQGSMAIGAGSSDIWVDVVARQLQKDPLCAYFTFTGQTFAPATGCTNYAIGGGRINTASNPEISNPADPRSILLQLQAAAQVHGGYTASDVLLVVGGGNDAADLTSAVLKATDAPGQQAYLDLLASALGADAVAAVSKGSLVAGAAYMTKLADQLADAIVVHAVNQGATKVLVMNLPDISLTPDFGAVLETVTQGGGNAADVQLMIKYWVDTFNQHLASRFAAGSSSSKVAVLDYNTIFRAQVASGLLHGFTDTTKVLCPPVGPNAVSTFMACTASALSAQQGKPAADWWTTYMFSDGFHPTPLAHAKAANEALKILSDRGWN